MLPVLFRIPMASRPIHADARCVPSGASATRARSRRSGGAPPRGSAWGPMAHDASSPPAMLRRAGSTKGLPAIASTPAIQSSKSSPEGRCGSGCRTPRHTQVCRADSHTARSSRRPRASARAKAEVAAAYTPRRISMSSSIGYLRDDRGRAAAYPRPEWRAFRCGTRRPPPGPDRDLRGVRDSERPAPAVAGDSTGTSSVPRSRASRASAR